MQRSLLLIWWRTFQLEDWRTFQLVSTALKTITIGKGIISMKDGEFGKCTSMESLYIKATTPPTIGNNVFIDNPCTIYVPRGCGNAYRTATNWSAYANRIQEYDFN